MVHRSKSKTRPLTITPEVIARVASLLGRQPRGLEEIAVAHPDGRPMVIRVASLVDDKPFPTLFWLLDPDLCYRIDQVEATGLIRQLQQRIDADPQLQCGMDDDHRAHIKLREAYMTPQIRRRLAELHFSEVFARKGIGGIADFKRIRCLHTWYAAHLVAPNTVGLLLDDYWRQRDG
ncbi:MAG: DUF501 domain-containing protein [Gammaproteobacteria bacterium]|nr:MAG: DUF501 domain-containing protein [Gammaproteobacteria bacterium]RLA57812.1 MAG: DUF501 domain-containing protein [Gammaproteobacteria bacterium]